MGSGWFNHNWFSLLQSAGIIGSLLFTGLALRNDTKARRVTNLLTVTDQHREIWTNYSRRPELARVLDPNADVSTKPATEAEEAFIRLLLVHLQTSRHALLTGMLGTADGLQKDVAWFFSLPVPRAVAGRCARDTVSSR